MGGSRSDFCRKDCRSHGIQIMTVSEIAQKCGWKLLAGKDGSENEVNSCYAGDLLSWVMGRAGEGNLWFTVMGNVNAIAVATLRDISGIVLTESAPLDDDAAKRADMQSIPVYQTEENTYDTAVKVYEILKNGQI
jgi:predicted transcriptional regulator